MAYLYDTITTNNLNVTGIHSIATAEPNVMIHGNLEVTGRITSQSMQESDAFKDLKKEVKSLKTQLEGYKEHVKLLENKLDELYYAPGGPMFNLAKISFENNQNKQRGEN